MIKGKAVRALLRDAKSGKAFKEKFREMLGLVYHPRIDQWRFDPAKQQIGTEEFSIRELTEHFCGQEFVSEMHSGPLSSARLEMLKESRTPKQTALFEDVVGVDPSVMSDINAWSATIAGLVEVRLLQGYTSPEFIANNFVEIKPSRQNGGKLIAVPYVNPKVAKHIAPGVEFPTAGLNQLYVWARPNMKVGSKLALTREAVVYDLSGELLSSAETIGNSLQWIREYVIAGGCLGLSNVVSSAVDMSITEQITSSFRMNAGPDSSPNPTYQTASAGGIYSYVNQQQNELADWTDLNNVQALLNLMRDPVNGLPFATEITKLFVNPALYQQALYILHQTQVHTVTGTPAVSPFQGSNSTMPPIVAQSPSYGSSQSQLNKWTPFMSNIWHQALLDAGVSEANAKKRWLAGDPQKAFVWQQAWDLSTQQANPSDAEMLGKDVVAMWVSSWSGQFVVREPRFNILNTE